MVISGQRTVHRSKQEPRWKVTQRISEITYSSELIQFGKTLHRVVVQVAQLDVTAAEF